MSARASPLVIAAVLLLASCAPASDPDTLRIVVEKAPSNLDPRVGSDQASSRAHALLYRGLFTIGNDLAPRGDLVKEVEQPDDLNYVLHLEPGVRFSDGRPLTSADVLYTIESIRSGTSFRKPDLAPIARAEAPDPLTVTLHIEEPFSPLLTNLTFGIVPSGDDDANAHPIGAGPYALAARPSPYVMDFERVPPVPPGAFRRVRLQAIPDEMARSLAIRKGDVDLVVNDLAPEVLGDLAHDRRYVTIVSRGGNYAYVMMNCEVPALRDPRVRQAIAFAIDKKAMIEALLYGMGREATGLLPPESWAYARPPDPYATYPYDPARAAELLDAAGFPDPDGAGPRPRLRLSYKASSLLSSRAQAAVIQDFLARVGIEIRIQSYEWSTFYEDIKRGNFELCSLVWVGVTDPDGLRSRFHSSMRPPEGANRGRYASAAVDALLDRGARELELAERRRIYAEAQAIIARDAPYVSLWYKDNFALVRKGIEGVDLGPFGSFDFVARLRRERSAP